MALSNRQKQHVEAWQITELTKSEYCRQQGLNLKTFSRWCRLARSQGAIAEQQLIPVQLQGTPASSLLSLRLPQGQVLEIPASVSARWLGELLQCLA
jgi:hypothetical protein